MPEPEISGEENQKSSSSNGSISRFKRTHNQNESPISPLSPESPSCGSIDLAIDDAVDNSIEVLYQNICDMESSNDTHSMRSFTTYGNESRIDSELRHLVGLDTDTEEEDVKEVVVVETPPSKDEKMEKAMKGTTPKVKTVKGKKATDNVKSIDPKPPIAKRNMIKSAKSLMSGKKSNDNPYLGPYLLMKARDIISSGDNPKKALEFAVRAKKSFESCPSDKPNLDHVMCLHVLASMYCSSGKHDEAIPLLERSIEIPRVELGQNHALAKFVGCMRLGDIYAMQGKIEDSILSYKAGLEVQKQVLGEQDPRFGETCRYVAEAHVQAFEFDEAEKLCQMALDIHKAKGSKGSPLSVEEAADRRLMGLICDSKGKYEAALEHYVLASSAMPKNGQESDVAAVDCNIGDAFLALGRYDEAVSAYQKALSSFKSCKGENHPAIASVYVHLAELYNKVGKFGDSNSYCEKALEIYCKFGSNTQDIDIASGLIDLSAIYESMNDLPQALNLLAKALEIYRGASPRHNCTMAGIESQMGVIHYMMGNYTDSYSCLRSSVSRFQASGEKKSSLYGVTLNQLGLTCVELGEISEAAEIFEEARSVLEREYGSYHPDTLGVYSNLAGTCDALGRWDEAIELLEFVVGMREEKLGTADHIVDDEKRRLSELLKEAGRGRRRNSRSLETLLVKSFSTRVR